MDWKKVLKSYSGIITKTIPLFLAVGFLNILFSESGWFPNQDMEDMAAFLCHMAVPVLLGYYAGKRPGNQTGGITGAIASAGLVCAGSNASILGAVVVGGMAGFVSDRCCGNAEKRLPAGFEMIAKNLIIGTWGILFGAAGFYVFAPCFQAAGNVTARGLGILTARGLLPLVSLAVEPLKILFLNNSLNHGVFIPLGMEQMEAAGKSALFLMETNPGPGLGILLSHYVLHREKRGDTATVMAVHLLGGIHEVYFPYVLSDLRLLAAVMAGGAAGTLGFGLLGAGLKGPVSPGSIFTILLMSGDGGWTMILSGVAVSAAVSFGAACLISGSRWAAGRSEPRDAPLQDTPPRDTPLHDAPLRDAPLRDAPLRDAPCLPKYRTETGTADSVKKDNTMREGIMGDGIMEHGIMGDSLINDGRIASIYVVCDAGLGSSAMGAALLRRKLREAGAGHVRVQAAPYDDIPPDADLLVCQKDFYNQRMKGRETVETIQIEKLTSAQEYARLIERVKGRI